MDEKGSYNILLLDDDEDDYLLIKDVLAEAFDAQVKLDWFQRDNEAAEMVCSGSYALTLVDNQLGPQDGVEVIRNIKAQCPDQVVYLISGWQPEKVIENAREAGANGYLRKKELTVERMQSEFTRYFNSGKKRAEAN